MTLDACICWNNVRVRHRRRAGMYGSLGGAVVLGGLLFDSTVVLSTGVAIAILGTVYILCVNHRDNKFLHAIREWHEHVPVDKFEAAGGWEDWPRSILWAVECEEAHMPGDCPLCGAD